MKKITWDLLKVLARGMTASSKSFASALKQEAEKISDIRILDIFLTSALRYLRLRSHGERDLNVRFDCKLRPNLFHTDEEVNTYAVKLFK